MSKTSSIQNGKAFISLSAGLLGGMLGTFVMPVQIGSFIKYIGLNQVQAGTLGSVELMVGAVVMTLVSFYIHPMGSLRKWATIAATVVVVAQLATGFSSSYTMLRLLRLITGCGSGVLFASVLAATSVFKEPERMIARASALTSGVAAVFLWILPAIEKYGAHKGIFFSLAMVWVGILFSLKWLPTPQPKNFAGHASIAKPSIIHLFLFLGGILLLAFAQGALWSCSERIGAALHLTPGQIGATLAISSIAMIGGALFADFLGLRLGYVMPMVMGSIANGVVCLTATKAAVFMVYISAISVYGFVFYAAYPYVIGYGALMDGSGRLASMAGSVYMLGYSVGPMGGGYIISIHSPREVGWACLGLSMAAVIAFLLMFCLGKPAPALQTVEK